MANLIAAFGAALVLLCTNCLCAKILGVVPTPSYSHQVVFFPLWKELSLRGHQVTLCTTDSIKDPSLINLTEINWRFAYDVMNRKGSFSKVMQNTKNGFFDSFARILEMMREIQDEELNHAATKKLISDENVHFDLVMAEFLLPTVMPAFASRFNCPLIGLISLDAPSMVHQMLGNPTHPVLYPDFMLPFTEKLNFYERLLSVLFQALVRMGTFTTFEEDNSLVKKHFGKSYPPVKEIWRNISMLFINVNPIFHTIRPLSPSTVQIGGGLQLRTPKSIPEDIKSFLDNSTEGVVYFSLGSNAKSKEIPDETKKVIMDTFAELPYKVLWKFEDEDLPGKPANVKISKWLPQQDVLRHPNIKLFITQGGLQSIEEAIYSHVPMIGMPYFGDQPMNVKKLVSRGMGLQVDKDNIEKGAFKETILEVINNPRYRNKVKELAELALDQPMTGLEKAVWWTEYVIRHKGAPHLKSPAVDIPLYQYFLLDVIGFLLAVLLISIWVAYKMIRLILGLFLKSSNIDTNKKKN